MTIFTRLKNMKLNQELSVEEEQKTLMNIFNRYLEGDISLKELRAAERKYSPDYSSAFLELSKNRRQFSRAIRRLLGRKTEHEECE